MTRSSVVKHISFQIPKWSVNSLPYWPALGKSQAKNTYNDITALSQSEYTGFVICRGIDKYNIAKWQMRPRQSRTSIRRPWSRKLKKPIIRKLIPSRTRSRNRRTGRPKSRCSGPICLRPRRQRNPKWRLSKTMENTKTNTKMVKDSKINESYEPTIKKAKDTTTRKVNVPTTKKAKTKKAKINKTKLCKTNQLMAKKAKTKKAKTNETQGVRLICSWPRRPKPRRPWLMRHKV